MMSGPIATQFEAYNAQYANHFSHANIADSHESKVLVLVCMDARIDPAEALGLQPGQAHVVRNAGGRAIDAVRSIIISQQLLGTREIVVVHHTDCGMLGKSDNDIRCSIKDKTGEDVDHIAFLPFRDLRESVLDDIRLLEKNPWF
uniref:Carbonic anhydrase n=1 Tax=Bionectria ochroleuca TaxID=29856 RepID=A0A8H7K5X9_BIOOC